jgi:competence protein ComEC
LGEAVILDIGHGNSAVLSDDFGVVIIDAGVGATLLEFLHEGNIREIDEVIISHADSDHISGIISLLSQRDLLIHTIRLNGDAAKNTTVWNAFRVALADARKRGETRVYTELTTTSTDAISRGEIRIEVLAPTPEIIVSGVGGRDLRGRQLSANSVSAVIRVVNKDVPQVLFAGDIDGIGLDNLLEEYPEPRARVLVFPHHGGRPGRDDAFEFAYRLCGAVLPEIVVFSIGRGKHGTPLPEIIRGVRLAVPKAHVACTQLSERCAATLPAGIPHHLSERAARGRSTNSCCCGTLELMLGEMDIARAPSLNEHRQFVMREAPTALCIEGRSEADD